MVVAEKKCAVVEKKPAVAEKKPAVVEFIETTVVHEISIRGP